MGEYFPVALHVKGRPCLVMGEGDEVEKKAVALLEAGANLRIISTAVSPFLQTQAEAGILAWEVRRYTPRDIRGHFVVFVCTSDPGENEELQAEARASGAILNVVDQTAWCDFIMPAIVRQGSLTIAVTTDGKSPALARFVKERLAGQFGPEYASFLEILGILRPAVNASGMPWSGRVDLYWRLIESEILALLRAKESARVHRCITNVLKEFAVPLPEELSAWLGVEGEAEQQK